MLTRLERRRVRELHDELLTLRLGGAAFADTLLPEVHDLLGFENTLLYSVRNRTGRWELGRWEAAGSVSAAESSIRRMFACAPTFPLYYDPISPPALHRNRVVEARAWIDDHAPDTYDQCLMYTEVLEPAQLHRHYQPRVLLCDGPSLIGWFGGLHPEHATARQRRLLSVLSEPLRRRLIAEAQLLDAPLAAASLEAMLDRIGAPAFVVDARRGIRETNLAGRALLDATRAQVTAALADTIAGRPSRLEFELIEVRGRGIASAWIAVLRATAIEDRMRSCVATCAHRWGLTVRQRQVLDLLVRGTSNAAIAATLGCSERTVEVHVTALLGRADVEGRAALVAVVLTSS